MIARFAAPLALLAGFGLAVAFPSLTSGLRQTVGMSSRTPLAAATANGGHTHGGTGEEEHAGEGRIVMTAEQITAAGIQLVAAGPGVLRNVTTVPGVLVANGDRLARIPARASGTVLSVRKGLGEPVRPGDVLALVESRDVAEAKADLLAAERALTLADAIHGREARLWKQRISAQNDVLVAAAAAAEARIKHDTARQRLSILGLTDTEIAAVPRQGIAERRILEVRSSIGGQVVARAAVPGAAVSAEHELFSVADLSTLWVEMTLPPRDLPSVRKGELVRVSGDGQQADARVVFVNPMLDPETRSARALAELPNVEGAWRPGAFVTVGLSSGEQAAELVVPREAVQEIERETAVFVHTPEGFEKREVALGRTGTDHVEIIFGLDPGQEVAGSNAFALKAELGKSEAGHAH